MSIDDLRGMIDHADGFVRHAGTHAERGNTDAALDALRDLQRLLARELPRRDAKGPQ